MRVAKRRLLKFVARCGMARTGAMHSLRWKSHERRGVFRFEEEGRSAKINAARFFFGPASYSEGVHIFVICIYNLIQNVNIKVLKMAFVLKNTEIEWAVRLS